MAEPTPLFVGLDVHKDSIAVAHALGQSADPPVFVGTVGTRQADLDTLIRRLQAKTPALVFAYEAGPAAHSWKAGGPIAIRRRCPNTFSVALRVYPNRLRTSAGRRRSDCASGFDDSSRVGSIRMSPSRRSRANSWRSCLTASLTQSRVGVGGRPRYVRNPRRR